MSATIGTGNIVGVATAIAAGGPGALFWMIVAAFFGMATKYAEGLLAIKYRTIDKDGHVLGGPFYYIENGMGKQWRWLAKIFAFFGAGVGLFGIGTFTQVNGIASAVKNFFDPDTVHTVSLFGNTYSWATVIACLILTLCVGLVVLGGIQRIAKVSQIIVPFMAVLYVALALIIVITNITAVPGAIATIVKTASTEVPLQAVPWEPWLWQCRKVLPAVFSQTSLVLVALLLLQLPLRQRNRFARDLFHDRYFY